jgi:RNA polymerase-binding transcription factor DksA
MDPEVAKERLEDERVRLEQTRSAFDDEHLRDESEGENVSELSSVDQHPADVGTETFEREKDISILEQVEAELADIEHALKRLEEGTYGICEACSERIEEARLEAMPAARFCIKDQALAEDELRRRTTAG